MYHGKKHTKNVCDTFDPDYGCIIVVLFLEDLSLSNLGKHLLLVKEHLQDLVVCFTLCLPDLSSLLCILSCVDGWR
jgi:hypothetical protein